jgi:acyl carrier protein
MDPSPPASTANPAIEDKLRHLPGPAREAYRRFQAGADPADLDAVLFAILEDFSSRKPAPALASFPGDTRLMDDLGFDSLALTEIIFFAEDLFGISISNEEILQVRTLDDLRHFIRRKVTARTAR